MTWKTGLIIGVVILFLGVVGSAVYKIIQSTETYKAQEQIYYSPTYNFAPLSFGCANFRAEAYRAEKEKPVQPVKK